MLDAMQTSPDAGRGSVKAPRCGSQPVSALQSRTGFCPLTSGRHDALPQRPGPMWTLGA
jgi:hypothetical protein